MDSVRAPRPGSRALTVTATLVLVVLLCGTLRADGAGGRPHDDNRAWMPSGRMVKIDGESLGRLWPGVMTPMRITLRNRTGVRVAVSRLRIRIVRITAPQATASRPCTRQDFRIRQVSPQRMNIAPRKQLVIVRRPGRPGPKLGIVNRPLNQDGCQGAVVQLAFKARVVRRP